MAGGNHLMMGRVAAKITHASPSFLRQHRSLFENLMWGWENNKSDLESRCHGETFNLPSAFFFRKWYGSKN
jgi:hypothetical protein